MKKLETLEELAKAAGHLAGYFKGQHAHHTAKAAAHESSVTEHTEMEAFHKGMHDALEDGHADKAYHKRAAEHHAQRKAHHSTLHKLHKEHADRHADLAAAYGEEKAAGAGTGKAAGSATAATDGVEGMIAATTQGLVKKSLEMLNTDETVANTIRQMVLEGVQKALSGQIVPDHVRGVVPSNPPADGVRLIPRSGASSGEVAKVAADQEDMFVM